MQPTTPGQPGQNQYHCPQVCLPRGILQTTRRLELVHHHIPSNGHHHPTKNLPSLTITRTHNHNHNCKKYIPSSHPGQTPSAQQVVVASNKHNHTSQNEIRRTIHRPRHHYLQNLQHGHRRERVLSYQAKKLPQLVNLHPRLLPKPPPMFRTPFKNGENPTKKKRIKRVRARRTRKV